MSQPIVPIFVARPDDPFVVEGDLEVQGDEVVDGNLTVKGQIIGGGGAPGSGTVTSIIAGNQLTGGTITSSGTIAVSTTPSFATLILTGGIGTLSNNVNNAFLALFNGMLYPELQNNLTGSGTESSPYSFTDNTAGIQTVLSSLVSKRGGKIQFSSSRYNLTTPIQLTIPNITFEGVSSSYPIAPDAIALSNYGSNLYTTNQGIVFRTGTAPGNPTYAVQTLTSYGGIVMRDFAISSAFVGGAVNNFINWDSSPSTAIVGIVIANSEVGDQSKINNMSFQNLGTAIFCSGNGNLDTWTFDGLNSDGTSCGFYNNGGLIGFTKFINCCFSDGLYWAIFNGFNGGSTGNWYDHCQFSRNAGTSDTSLDSASLRCAVYLADTNSTITNCNFVDTGHTTYWLGNGSQATATPPAGVTGLIISAPYIRVLGNSFQIITVANSNGIWCQNGSLYGRNSNAAANQVTLSGNTFNGAADNVGIQANNFAAIRIDSGTTVRVNSNLIFNAFSGGLTQWGVVVSGSSHAINDNLIVGCTIGIWLTSASSSCYVGANTYNNQGMDVQIDAGATGNTVFLTSGMKIVDNGTGTILLNYALVTAGLVTLTGTDATRVMSSL